MALGVDRVISLVSDFELTVAQVISMNGSHENKLAYKAAQAANRDSRHMRVIAQITFMLLPATCAAVSLHHRTSSKDRLVRLIRKY